MGSKTAWQLMQGLLILLASTFPAFFDYFVNISLPIELIRKGNRYEFE
jgi:hypothetical protein